VTGTDEQNDVIVADYFAMLAEDISEEAPQQGRAYRPLPAMIGSPRVWIEYRHQNN
jgi:hypothetical protein